MKKKTVRNQLWLWDLVENCSDCVGNDTVKPHILKKVHKPKFKVVEAEFDVEALLIRQELNDEENKTVKSPVIVILSHG